jgi:hypothetical protein
MSSSTMRRTAEAVEAECTHQFDIVDSHFAFAVMAGSVADGRPGAVAITAQVGRHHGEMFGQSLGDLVPDHVGLRVAMQQQQARAVTADAVGDVDAIDVTQMLLESSKHAGGPRDVFPILGHRWGRWQSAKRDGPVHESCCCVLISRPPARLSMFGTVLKTCVPISVTVRSTSRAVTAADNC